MRTIICDIDGTLANLDHRLPLVTHGNRDWPGFFSLVHLDTLIEPVAAVVNRMGEDHHLVLCSGRSEECRDATITWLAENGVDYDTLMMRAAGDYRPDNVIKSEMLDRILAHDHEVVLVIDDRPQVIQMWEERGLFVLRAPWHDDKDGIDRPQPGMLSLMVGPSGAGKSEWLEDQCQAEHSPYNIRRSQIISSDQIRADFCGDFRNQGFNEHVFRALHDLVRTRVRNGLPTVVDATNLKRRDRLAVVDCTIPDGPVRYFVLDRPMHQKIEDAGWRREVPELIERHDAAFKGNLRHILAGDDRPNVQVIDLRLPHLREKSHG